jgi:WD40 repeat protein
MLDGSLSEAAQFVLGAHLEGCACCQQTLEELAGGTDAWSAAARHLGGEPAEDGASLRRVLADLEADEPAAEAVPGEPDWAGGLGHYKVLGVLGRGGMGVVLKGFDRALHRVVAIKVMAPQLAGSAGARKRFVREARAAAAVRNEHVVNIHAVEDVSRLPYLVMEYIAGKSLQQRIDRDGPLGLEEILRIGTQVARGLTAAHAEGLIHRDIKPANILLENGVERVKITDFGLARAADEGGASQNGVVAGTPQYMAPEQARGEPLDPRADLFSLGSVLYAMCTGQPPFPAGPTLAVLRDVCEGTPRPIEEVNPAVPGWLTEIVARLHAKDPARRFASAAEVADLLAERLAQLRRPASSAVRLVPRRRRLLIAAAALLVIVGGLGVTEAVGVTRLSSAVVRVLTPDGTLIVESDDAQVRVTVEGDGGLLITGAGPQEVRLRPGSYRFRASKDGKTVREELLTISRGGRQVVKVSGEGGLASQPPPPPPFQGHTDPVLCLAVSPDGRRALSGSADKTVRLWDVASGQEVRRFLGHTDGVNAVAFSGDGKRAVSAGRDRTVRVWNVETGAAVCVLRGHTQAVLGAALDAGGRLAVSGGQDGTVRLWDVAGGTEVRSLAGHEGWIAAVAISPDGERILSGGHDGTVRVWDRAGKELHRLEGHTREVYAVAFSPDGRRAASGGNDALVRLWDVETGEALGRLAGHANAVVRVAFSADGRQVLSASSQYEAVDKTLRVWDAASGREVCSYGGADTDRVGCAAFAPDGKLALTGGSDPALRRWNLSK